MNTNVLSCMECGGSIKVSEGQFVSRCNYCGTDYFVVQKFPPAILIKRSIDIRKAKNIVLMKLKDKNVSKEFLKNSYFERGTLYFVPFVEIRGIKTKFIHPQFGEKKKFSYVAFEYIERGSELTELDIEFIDMNSVEETLVNAEQESFNLVNMRKSGIVLPLSGHAVNNNSSKFLDSGIVEQHSRVIYLPVWEINYSYRGIIFHSYISAVDGTVIEIKAMKNHRRKILFSISGLAVIGTIFAKLVKIGLVFLLASRRGSEIAFYNLIGIMGGLILSFFLFLMLFPFFWEMFAFREYLIITRDGVDSRTINFEENFITKLIKKISEKIGKILENIKIKVEDE